MSTNRTSIEIIDLVVFISHTPSMVFMIVNECIIYMLYY